MREKEERREYPIYWLFKGLPEGLASILPDLGYKWDVVYSRCLGTTRNEKELGGLLQLQKRYSTTDSRQARNYELMKETSKTSLIENLHSQVQRHIYIKDLRGPQNL